LMDNDDAPMPMKLDNYDYKTGRIHLISRPNGSTAGKLPMRLQTTIKGYLWLQFDPSNNW